MSRISFREGDLKRGGYYQCRLFYHSERIFFRFFPDVRIGEVSPEKKKLVQVTKECVELGLKEVKPWGFLGDMGQAVHDHAYANGYTVVREIGGHGVGLEFHEEPWVGYNSRRGTQMVLAPGMIFTIEPMVNMAVWRFSLTKRTTGKYTPRMECHLHSGRSWFLSLRMAHEVLSW